MQIEHALLHQKGARPYNEDCFGVWENERYGLYLVADGAGGQGGGEVASVLARDTLLENFAKAPGLDPRTLKNLLTLASQVVVQHQQSEKRLNEMRSTVVLLVVDRFGEIANWAWCGDSRGYFFRQGLIEQRTVDHSLVQHMLDAGLIDELMAQEHPKRNLLWSALGNSTEELQIGVGDSFQVQEGDSFLLCSDGVWEPLGDALLSDALIRSISPRAWLDQLNQAVKDRSKPEQDNYTALALRVSRNDDVTRIL